MIRKIVAGILFPLVLFSGKALEVSADRFTHVASEHRAVFEGNAHAKEGKSRIDARKFIVYFDANNSAKEYRAIGDVRFEIVRPDQHVKGRCDRLTYRVDKETYRLSGNARVIDLLNKRRMQGEEIFLDNKNHSASAKSGREGPVKFIFQMEDKSKKKKQKR